MAARLVHTTTDSNSESQLRRLKSTIEFMDSISQDACSQISSIAQLALAFFERPNSRDNLELIAKALRAIWEKADALENDINTQASELGCGYVDEPAVARSSARMALHAENNRL